MAWEKENSLLMLFALASGDSNMLLKPIKNIKQPGVI